MEEELQDRVLEEMDDADLFRAKAFGFSDVQLGTLTGSGEAAGEAKGAHDSSIRPVYQAGGHLRGGVRGLHALLLFHLRAGGRATAGPHASSLQAQGDDPGRRAQPHRAGDRVRLLLRARLLRPARGGLRVHHGQQQPRDRLHRLRHLRPPLLRAPDPGGRAGDRGARRSPRASSCSSGGRRP